MHTSKPKGIRSFSEKFYYGERRSVVNEEGFRVLLFINGLILAFVSGVTLLVEHKYETDFEDYVTVLDQAQNPLEFAKLWEQMRTGDLNDWNGSEYEKQARERVEKMCGMATDVSSYVPEAYLKYAHELREEYRETTLSIVGYYTYAELRSFVTERKGETFFDSVTGVKTVIEPIPRVEPRYDGRMHRAETLYMEEMVNYSVPVWVVIVGWIVIGILIGGSCRPLNVHEYSWGSYVLTLLVEPFPDGFLWTIKALGFNIRRVRHYVSECGRYVGEVFGYRDFLSKMPRELYLAHKEAQKLLSDARRQQRKNPQGSHVVAQRATYEEEIRGFEERVARVIGDYCVWCIQHDRAMVELQVNEFRTRRAPIDEHLTKLEEDQAKAKAEKPTLTIVKD